MGKKAGGPALFVKVLAQHHFASAQAAIDGPMDPVPKVVGTSRSASAPFLAGLTGERRARRCRRMPASPEHDERGGEEGEGQEGARGAHTP